MIAEFKRFLRAFKKETTDFSFFGMQSRHAIRCAVATTVATLLALALNMDMPFWSGISAMVVTEKKLGITFWKCILRVSATAIGALIGVTFGLLFSTHILLFCVVIYLCAGLSMYLMNIYKRYSYLWVLGLVSALLVMLMGVVNPEPEYFIHLAFYRFAEVCIGVFAGLLCSGFIFPEYSLSSGKHTLRDIYRLMSEIFDKSFDILLSTKTKQLSDEYHNRLQQMQKKATQLVENANSIRSEQMFQNKDSLNICAFGSCVTPIHQGLKMLMEIPVNLSLYRSELKQIQDCYQHIFIIFDQVIRSKIKIHDLWLALTKTHDKIILIRQNVRKQHPDIDYSFHILQKITSLMLTCVKKTKPIQQATVASEKKKLSTIISNNSTYIVKFSAIYALAVLLVPFLWLMFDFSGFDQIAISIVACVSFSGEMTRYKSLQRLLGCVAGCVITIVFLWLSIDNLYIYLIFLFICCYCFLYFRAGKPDVSYFGLQAGVVFITGGVAELTPAISIEPSCTRLLGIFLGVMSLYIFQRLFWQISENDHFMHRVYMLKQSIYNYLKTILYNRHIEQEWETHYDLEKETNTILNAQYINQDFTEVSMGIVANYRSICWHIIQLRMMPKKQLNFLHVYHETIKVLLKILTFHDLEQAELTRENIAHIQLKLSDLQMLHGDQQSFIYLDSLLKNMVDSVKWSEKIVIMIKNQ